MITNRHHVMATYDTESLYERLIRPVEDRMMRSIARVLPNPIDAGDAMQAATVKILGKLDTIQSHPNPGALILRICIDEALSIVRRRSRDQLSFVESIDDSIPNKEPRPDQSAVLSEMEEETIAAIGRLPSLQAQAVYQRLILDHHYNKIAQTLDCSEEAVRQHVARGRKRLASELSHWLESSSHFSS